MESLIPVPDRRGIFYLNSRPKTADRSVPAFGRPEITFLRAMGLSQRRVDGCDGLIDHLAFSNFRIARMGGNLGGFGSSNLELPLSRVVIGFHRGRLRLQLLRGCPSPSEETASAAVTAKVLASFAQGWSLKEIRPPCSHLKVTIRFFGGTALVGAGILD